MFSFKIGTVFIINGDRYQIIGYQKDKFCKSGRAVIHGIDNGKRFTYGWEALKRCNIKPAECDKSGVSV